MLGLLKHHHKETMRRKNIRDL
jgi:hypothetical protein